MNTNHASTEDQQQTSIYPPYPPSFVDRFMNAIARLPIPYWLTYLVLFLLQSIAFHVLYWVDGWLPAYRVNALILLFPLWLWGPLAIITYLNRLSRESLSSFGVLLDITPERMHRLEYEFTTMPVRPVILGGIFWAFVYLVFNLLAFETVYVAYGFSQFSMVITIIEGLMSFLVGSVIYYHSIRQLRLVDRTVRMVKQFDLFRLDPVYAFSILTSQTGMAWVLLLTLTLLMIPIQIALIPTLIMLTLQIGLAVTAFALPLRIVNRRLVSEKRRLLAEVDQRVKSTLHRLNRSFDEDKFDVMDDLNTALTSLNSERDILVKIPTWPWRAGVLSAFLSVVVLPIALFILQLLISRMLD